MAFLLSRPFLSAFSLLSFFSIFWSSNLYGRQVFTAKKIIAAEYEVISVNVETYSKSRFYVTSPGRVNTVEYKGGKKALAGAFVSFQPSFLKKIRHSRLQFSFRSTLLLGQKNDNEGNSVDQEAQELDGENSFIFSTNLILSDWIFNLDREVLSIGKVRFMDVTSDGSGNRGDEVGRYNLRIKRTILTAFHQFGDFPFVLGIRGHRETIPRMVHTYNTRLYAGSGPLQQLTYHAVSAVMEMGEGQYLSNYDEGGFKWALNFSIGIAEYSFINYEGRKDAESSSTIGMKFSAGWQWNFQMFEQYWFLKWQNQFQVNSFDNNDNNPTSLKEGVVHRTSGSDEEYSLLIRTGVRFK
jgi:hypothetical protein